MGPVRVGNQAYEQVQHDAYGQIVLSSVQAYIDKRLYRMSGHEDFFALEEVGERAWKVYDQPDAGLWELRTRANVHTYSRSEEHTSELQSLMRISYAVFCLKTKTN